MHWSGRESGMEVILVSGPVSLPALKMLSGNGKCNGDE